MILISHRGNTDGIIAERENTPSYINEALSLGFHVEVDIWGVNGELFLGHDEPKIKVEVAWLLERQAKLWVHCKNIEALVLLKAIGHLHYFWHETDTVTITSKGYFWVYPNKQPVPFSIAVLPELHNDDVSACAGICSDFIENYKQQK